MRNRFWIKGPKLRTKLLLLGLILLVLPWLSYLQHIQMESVLLQGKKNSQLIVARTVATSFNTRADLFSNLPAGDETNTLFAHPILGSIMLDGDPVDWISDTTIQRKSFGGSGDGGFTLMIGEQIDKLFCFVEVNDTEIVYRDPSLLDLNTSDHLRLSYINSNSQLEQLLLMFSTPGVATAFRLSEEDSKLGVPDTRIGGFLRETESGVVIEIEFPIAILGSHENFSIAYHDVDDEQTRAIRQIVQSVDESGMESFNLSIVRSAEINELIESHGYVGLRILITDHLGRIRGALDAAPLEDQDTANSESPGWLSRVVKNLYIGNAFRKLDVADRNLKQQSVIESALRGEPQAIESLAFDGSPVIIAAHPIRYQDIVGAAVVEQNVESILAFQQQALLQMLLVSLLSLVVVIVVLLGFSIRLTYRIHKLRRATSKAIDEHGRLQISSLDTEITSGDEIGDLARAIDGMLTRLDQHQTFLKRMPRTLRHEINNPLNIVSTSLENLDSSTERVDTDRYLESARRGVSRLGRIVQNLSDAASLEDSLRNEKLEKIDLHMLTSAYISHLSASRQQLKFEFLSDDQPSIVLASDVHIEQMLDKIVDNAIDFHRPDSPICVFLERGRAQVRLMIANRGSVITGDANVLFDSLTSMRSTHSKLHFGLGLYVVRVIAEYHNGRVQAFNLPDYSGVVIVVTLPLAEPVRSAELADSTT